MALTTPFARNGNKKAVPQTTADGSVSYEQGFGNLYALPPEEGGLFIDREQFNQIMYDTTSAVISNQNSINTLNTKVANIESGATTGVVNLTTNQTINGIKTFSVPPVSATNPTNNNQVANKSYVDTVGNTAVKLTGAQTIQGVKTFSSIPISATQPTNANQIANKAYVDTVGNTAVKLTGAQSIEGAKTFTSNITAPNITKMQNSINTLTSQAEQAGNTLSTALKIVDFSKSSWGRKIITVGTSGADYDNLIDAINEAIKYQNNIRESSILGDSFGGWNVTEVIVRLTTNIEISSAVRITLSSGFLTIDLNKKTIFCTGGGGFAIGRPNALVQIVNGSIIKKNYSAPYTGIAIASYGLCVIGQSASFIDGNVDDTPSANGFVTIKGFEKGLWNGSTGIMQIQANISDCINCVYHGNSTWTNIASGTYSSNQASDGTSATPIYAINGGNLAIVAGTISSNIASGGSARSCIYVNYGTTATILSNVVINNQGIATKCNIASNTPSANGIVYTTLF